MLNFGGVYTELLERIIIESPEVRTHFARRVGSSAGPLHFFSSKGLVLGMIRKLHIIKDWNILMDIS